MAAELTTQLIPKTCFGVKFVVVIGKEFARSC